MRELSLGKVKWFAQAFKAHEGGAGIQTQTCPAPKLLPLMPDYNFLNISFISKKRLNLIQISSDYNMRKFSASPSASCGLRRQQTLAKLAEAHLQGGGQGQWNQA